MTIPTPGKLVGVVGPNGCGKSNVIDAVRWVLGESRAQHLRGEKMEDVIFNGSGNRKPVSRASVELIFDNSSGKAAGQWSQYAEISVKRVLTRQGESSYYINGQHVRRRDIQDMFMGTGLGPRAYAIIEQGMISRIIEAKPEELRVFLEEAAGISKYKERRKETESRLSDAKDNLSRLDDILRELTTQLEKLEGQAVVAEQYTNLKNDLATTQNLLAYSRRRDAQQARERHTREMEKLSAQLESQTSALHEEEARSESMREEHHTATEALSVLQGELYGANAEVSKLEQEIAYLRENRRRIESQLTQASQQMQDTSVNRESGTIELLKWQEELERAEEESLMKDEALEEFRARLPEIEQRVSDIQVKLADAQKAVSQAEQGQSVEESRENHALKLISQLEQRRNRLNQEKMSLAAPDEDEIQQMASELDEIRGQLAENEEILQEKEAGLPELEGKRSELVRSEQEASTQFTRSEAHLAALMTQQHRLDNNQKLGAWLTRHGLSERPRLWQQLSITQGWEDALESVLGARLNAIEIDDLQNTVQYVQEPPPGTVVFYAPSEQSQVIEKNSTIDGYVSLYSYVTIRNEEIRPFVEALLSNVYVLENSADGLTAISGLPSHVLLVTQKGHVYSKGGVLFYGPQSELHGVLQRQREIDDLKDKLPVIEASIEEIREQLSEIVSQIETEKTEIRRRSSEIGSLRNRAHSLQINYVKMSERAQQVAGRSAQIKEELSVIKTEEEREQVELREAQYNMEQGAARIEALVESEELIRSELRDIDAELNRQRSETQIAERAAQEARFKIKTCNDKIQSTKALTSNVEHRIVELSELQAALTSELAKVDEGPSSTMLQAAIEKQKECERNLAEARRQLEELSKTLRSVEESKLGIERGIDPLKEKITELRFKEQEARINEEQFEAQLTEANADLNMLAELIEKRRSNSLQSDINRLNQEINALGAVNLAALQELTESRERQSFLDGQATDLREAVETLETAIRRIDKETTELLQTTFDTVNKNFSELFPVLFGGGNANLSLTGEEILNAGVTVMAQPPGKKNASIHLLSGGEKALTALSLVFSLFRLNPAPFCLLDEVDAPLDDPNTERLCGLVRKMAEETQFLYISHNKITMEMAEQLIGITMQEQGVSRVVAVDIDSAIKLKETTSIADKVLESVL